MKWSILLFAAIPCWADNPVPYYPRSFDQNQSMGAINQNLQDITGRNANRLVPIVGDQACSAGQALTGATEKQGYIFGGSCSGVTFSSSTMTFPDGTIQTTAFSSMTIISSCTIVRSGSFTNTTFGVGYATVTVANNGSNNVTVLSSISIEGDNGQRVYASSFLIDGAFPSGTGATSAIGFKEIRNNDAAAANKADLSIYHVLDNATGGNIPSAGSHRYTLLFKTDAGTGYVGKNAIGQVPIMQFCVRQN